MMYCHSERSEEFLAISPGREVRQYKAEFERSFAVFAAQDDIEIVYGSES
jgi:hypothetical protein